jgi:hypothetical protein
MSALKHGFFRRGFMLCDRCVLSGKCELFVPGGECAVERKAYDGLVSELMRQYGLEGLADEILVRRVAMYLIRIARAEVYEANVGVSDASVVWGRYISGLDNTLRVLLRDLAITRTERKKLEKGDVLVDVDRLLIGLKQRSRVEKKMALRRSPMGLLIRDWRIDRYKLRRMVRGGGSAGREGDS